MKKILFLLLSVAVASSAFAGVKVNSVQHARYQQDNKAGKVTKAPVLTYNQNIQTMNINAPKVQVPQRNAVPGLSALQRTMKPATRAAITEQPEGTVSYYRRSGKAIFNQGVYTDGQLTDIEAAWGDQEGLVTVVENGNNIYFKNLLFDPEGWYPEAWVMGTKSGNVISIALPHDYDEVSYASYGVVIKLYWGSTRMQNGSLRWTRGSNSTAYFDIADDGTMTLRNGTSSTQWTGNGLCAAYQYGSSYYFDNAAILNTTLTPMGDIPEAPEMYDDDYIDGLDGEWVNYYRTGYYWFRTQNEQGNTVLDMDEQYGYGYIFYDADGSTVYMRDPVRGWNSGYWMKGTIEGNTLTFPLGQYVYWDDYFYGMKTAWGAMTVDEDNSLHFTEADVENVTFTIEGDHIIMNDCGTNEDMDTYVGLTLMLDSAYLDPGWYGPLDFWTVFYQIPGAPTEVTVQEGVTTANVSWTDETNSEWNVRYREWVDPATVDYYFNDFETDADLEGLTGWDMDGDGNWWTLRDLDDGTTCLTSASYINNQGALNPNNWLMLPEVTLNGVVKVEAWGQDASWAAEVFGVYIFVGDTADITNPETDFIQLGSDVTTDGTPTEYTFAIPEEYWGQPGYVAIVHHNISNMFYLNIDNVYVGDPDGGSPWIYVNGVTDPATVLQGLTPETTYEVQVQGVNAGGVGYWTESVVFTTLADQPLPTILRGDVDGDEVVGMGDLTALINYLVGLVGPDDINFENAAVCDSMTGDASEVVGMEDLTALINYLVYGTWPN